MSPSSEERFTAHVRGRVQGVGFRSFVVVRARALGLAGSVRNLPNGGVWVEAEGPRERLDRLLVDLRQGPPAARVTGVEVAWREPVGGKGFEIGWS
ncbi:MAG TPA: acylphosphatase [Candidatus Eisenbacteria bacterium]|jgi:acylphosphatase